VQANRRVRGAVANSSVAQHTIANGPGIAESNEKRAFDGAEFGGDDLLRPNQQLVANTISSLPYT